MSNPMEHFQLAVDSNRGIYSGQAFAEKFSFDQFVRGMNKETYDILLIGPDHGDYVEAYADLCGNDVRLMIDGSEFTIYQHDDIWLVPIDKDHEIDWEAINN